MSATKPASKPTMVKNAAAAPFLYFDGAPSMGVQNGMVEVELAARGVMPNADGTVYIETICVAHLRCSLAAADNLRGALERVLDMAADAAEASRVQQQVDAAPAKH